MTNAVSSGVTPTQLADQLTNDPGITAFNATYTGHADSAGIFSGGSPIFGIGSGVILSTGDISSGISSLVTLSW